MHWCLVLCILLCLCVGVFCDQGAAVQSIDCKETAESFLASGACSSTQNCTLHCQDSCYNDSYAEVLGTVLYAQASSICKSALHDLRISSWNASARTATFVASGQHDRRKDFFGSVRFNIPSKDYFQESTYFYFTSPRVTEEILDVTMLHRNFIYTSDKQHKSGTSSESTPSQECHVPDNYSAYFDYTLKELELNATVNLSPSPSNGRYTITWPATLFPHIRTNMFWCRIHNRMTSDIASPAMYFAAPIRPRHYTITVSLGDPLSIEVDPQGGGKVEWWVRNNGSGSGDQPIVKNSSDNIDKLIYERAALHHSGERSAL
ncbi:uncharacterized protein LOC135390533 [Ornithodoros turicata]|uniref:uncharacterized protein LOC135390533 n=1 Tax=Ornithodoros turicata TaxID=34597 RepID=UPI003138BB92